MRECRWTQSAAVTTPAADRTDFSQLGEEPPEELRGRLLLAGELLHQALQLRGQKAVGDQAALGKVPFEAGTVWNRH